jgi:ATP-binding cassette subfamily B multidrug efflux pump
MSVAPAMRRLLPYYRPYVRTLVVGLVLVVISSGLGAVTPWLLRSGIDDLAARAPVSRIVWIAAAIIGIGFVGGALRFWMREILNGLSRYIEYDLRQALFAHLTTLDPGYFARTRTGDIMARLTNDLSAVRMAAGPAIMYLTNTVFGAAFALAFMLRIDVRLTLIALLPMVLLPLVMIVLGGRIHSRFEAVQEHFSTLTTQAQENFAGVRVVRAYRQERAEIERFAALNDTYVEKNMRLARLYGAMNPLFGLLAGLSVVVVLGLGGRLVVQGVITVGAFVAFGFYLSLLTWPLIALGWVINLFQRGAASMARLLEVLDARAEVASPLRPVPLPAATGGRAIEFRGVGFHYPVPEGGPARWVLRDVSFRIEAGATLAVVGATGSGKSALIDLIPRLSDPQEGEILIDGIPLRDLALNALRAEIGYVQQESFLFSDTIASNLAYGDASRSRGRPRDRRRIRAGGIARDRRARRHGASLGGGGRTARRDGRGVPARIWHAAGRARHQPERRPEAAPRPVARSGATPAHRPARRRTFGGGHPHGGGDPPRAARHAGRPHRGDRVTPHQRRARCDVDHRARRRARRRAGRARHADQCRGTVQCASVAAAARGGVAVTP